MAQLVAELRSPSPAFPVAPPSRASSSPRPPPPVTTSSFAASVQVFFRISLLKPLRSFTAHRSGLTRNQKKPAKFTLQTKNVVQSVSSGLLSGLTSKPDGFNQLLKKISEEFDVFSNLN
jgi:hypothetical protein